MSFLFRSGTEVRLLDFARCGMIPRKEVTREIQARTLAERISCFFFHFTSIVGSSRSISLRSDEKRLGKRDGHGAGVEESSRHSSY